MEIRELTPEELLGPLNEVESEHAPKRLFAAGDVDMFRHAPRVSVVGSHKASAEGLCRARRLSTLFSSRGIIVVSGLADGIDAAAHIAALDANGKTVAVLDTPLDEVHPKRNEALQQRLIQEQLVLSQFPSGIPVQRGNFPLRNRTMALVSDVTVIIEAGEGSGSLSQGWEALRLGRPLFIAKSAVDDASLTWPREMLNYGAYVLSDETLDELFALLPDRALAELSSAPPF
jgi:DNA processing protein